MKRKRDVRAMLFVEIALPNCSRSLRKEDYERNTLQKS